MKLKILKIKSTPNPSFEKGGEPRKSTPNPSFEKGGEPKKSTPNPSFEKGGGNQENPPSNTPYPTAPKRLRETNIREKLPFTIYHLPSSV